MKIMPSADRQREDQRTYSRRKTCKPPTQKENRLNLLLNVLSFALLAIMVLLINAMFSMALPDPLGEKIQSHMAKFQPTP